MILPWVSRFALDCVLAENERQRQQIERLLTLTERLSDSLVRTERFSRGMPEEPKVPRETARMPPELLAQFAQIGDSRIRAMATRSAWQRFGVTGSWSDVMADMVRKPVAVDADWEPDEEDENDDA